jgi:putative NADH-flavin reductase
MVVFGASGKAGSRIVREAASRGHDVVAVARQFSALSEPPDGVRTAASAAAFRYRASGRRRRARRRGRWFRQVCLREAAKLSYEHFAVAVFEEIEHPRFIGMRFTVGY